MEKALNFAWMLLRGTDLWSEDYRGAAGRWGKEGRRGSSTLSKDRENPLFCKLWVVGWCVYGYLLKEGKWLCPLIGRSPSNYIGPWLSILYRYLKSRLCCGLLSHGPFETITNIKGQMRTEAGSTACIHTNPGTGNFTCKLYSCLKTL